MNAEDSPYQLSQAATSTDTTVHPPPSSTETNGSSNKRKRNEDGSAAPSHLNETVNARYPERVHANKLISKLHETVKLECAQLSDSCVRICPLRLPMGIFLTIHNQTGQSQIMGEPDHAQVRAIPHFLLSALT